MFWTILAIFIFCVFWTHIEPFWTNNNHFKPFLRNNENYKIFAFIDIGRMNIWIYSDIHSWSIYVDRYIQIFIRPISMIANIFEFSLLPKMVKNGYYWSKLVQYGPKITQNMKMAKIVQKNLGHIIWYSNTFEYFGRIFSFAKYLLIFPGPIYLDIHFWSFCHAEYNRIFIRPILMLTNMFRYSFVQKVDICPTLK